MSEQLHNTARELQQRGHQTGAQKVIDLANELFEAGEIPYSLDTRVRRERIARPKPPLNPLVTAFRDKRVAQGMSQWDVAAQGDLSLHTVAKFEQSRSTPAISTLRKYASAIKMDGNQLEEILLALPPTTRKVGRGRNKPKTK